MAHIFVIAGHGAGDPGAIGNGYQEAERVRALAERIAAYGGENVTVGDTNRNWYADNGISSLDISKDWQIIELHMDSAAASARGGHVIIKSGFSPDAFDNALANLVGNMFPGRSNLIVGRSDLANPNRAAAKGYGYRLVEFGFISNAEDVRIFNSRMDDLARGVVEAFQNAASDLPSIPVSDTQSQSNLLEIDGSCGPTTVRRWQEVMGTTVDGVISGQLVPDCTTYWRPNLVDSCVTYGGYGSDLIRAVQKQLVNEKRYEGEKDGLLGPNTIKAVQAHYGLAQDASFGPATVCALQTALNQGRF